MILIPQSTTGTPLPFLMVQSADHITALTGAAPTVTISKNGAAFGVPAGAVTELANGWYLVAGNATDTSTLGPLYLHASAASGDPTDVVVAQVIDPVRGVGSPTALPNAAAAASGGLPTIGATIPNATAGATGGLFIAGTNAATTISGSLTTTFTGNLTGSTSSVTGSVGSVATGGITTASFAAGSLTTSVFASGFLTSALIGTGFANTLSDNNNTRAVTETYSSLGGTLTLGTALYEISQRLGNMAIVSTTLTMFKRDGVTAAETFTLDSATTPTKITRAS